MLLKNYWLDFKEERVMSEEIDRMMADKDFKETQDTIPEGFCGYLDYKFVNEEERLKGENIDWACFTRNTWVHWAKNDKGKVVFSVPPDAIGVLFLSKDGKVRVEKPEKYRV